MTQSDIRISVRSCTREEVENVETKAGCDINDQADNGACAAHKAQRGCASQPQPRFLVSFASLMRLVTATIPRTVPS